MPSRKVSKNISHRARRKKERLVCRTAEELREKPSYHFSLELIAKALEVPIEYLFVSQTPREESHRSLRSEMPNRRTSKNIAHRARRKLAKKTLKDLDPARGSIPSTTPRWTLLALETNFSSVEFRTAAHIAVKHFIEDAKS